MVRILPLVAVQAKNATLGGAFVLQILFQGKEMGPWEDRSLELMYLKLLAAYPSHFAHSFILYCIYLSIQQYSRTNQDSHTYIHLYEIMTRSMMERIFHFLILLVSHC
jgi:hypothetical protein